MKWTAWMALLATAVIACATARLRPVESDDKERHEVEVSGGTCSYESIPLDVGVCSVREIDGRPRRLGQNRLVRCGETVTVCERSIRCDCSQPKRLFDCEPERTVIVHSDGGLTPVYPTRADGTRIPPLKGRRFRGSNAFGDCDFSMGAPRTGSCNVGGLIPNPTNEWVVMGGLSVPFGEERELCGVRLSCRCSEFTERERE